MTIFGRTPRALSTYDIPEIATWVDSRDYQAAYLDPETGEVYPAFEGMGPLDEDGEEVDLDDTDWVAIGGSDSRAAYQDMEDFAEAVADPLVARQLRDALGGRGAFRRFRDTMWHQPEEIGRAWSAYRELGAELRALEWLVDEGLVEEEDTRQERAARETAARGILEAVGGGRRARLILLNGMPGVGKSTLAELYRAEHPGVLLCDPDRLRPMIGGDPLDAGAPVRTLALAMATAHLRSGHDVVLPQLVADGAELQRFVAAAEEGHGELMMVMLHDDLDDAERAARPPSEGSQAAGQRADLSGPEGSELLTGYSRQLETMALLNRAAEVRCHPDDIEASYAQLLAVVARPD
jgi:hypothetical protein